MDDSRPRDRAIKLPEMTQFHCAQIALGLKMLCKSPAREIGHRHDLRCRNIGVAVGFYNINGMTMSKNFEPQSEIPQPNASNVLSNQHLEGNISHLADVETR